jgi:hypothetical protein
MSALGQWLSKTASNSSEQRSPCTSRWCQRHKTCGLATFTAAYLRMLADSCGCVRTVWRVRNKLQTATPGRDGCQHLSLPCLVSVGTDTRPLALCRFQGRYSIFQAVAALFKLLWVTIREYIEALLGVQRAPALERELHGINSVSIQEALVDLSAEHGVGGAVCEDEVCNAQGA